MQQLTATQGIQLAYIYARSLGVNRILTLKEICELYHEYQNTLSHLN